MSVPEPLGYAPNPFATRRVRPGALAFQFPGEMDARQCVTRLRAQGWWGQISGPHGSGKSTLLASLIPLLEAEGRRVDRIALRGGQSEGAHFIGRALRRWRGDTQVVADGYERLPAVRRWLLRCMCRLTGAGLLVTTHRDLGLPPLMQMTIDQRLVECLVAQLIDGRPVPINREDIECCFRRHAPNVREVLFALYDLVEQRRM